MLGTVESQKGFLPGCPFFRRRAQAAVSSRYPPAPVIGRWDSRRPSGLGSGRGCRSSSSSRPSAPGVPGLFGCRSRLREDGGEGVRNVWQVARFVTPLSRTAAATARWAADECRGQRDGILHRGFRQRRAAGKRTGHCHSVAAPGTFLARASGSTTRPCPAARARKCCRRTDSTCRSRGSIMVVGRTVTRSLCPLPRRTRVLR